MMLTTRELCLAAVQATVKYQKHQPKLKCKPTLYAEAQGTKARFSVKDGPLAQQLTRQHFI